jgi:hypothetical protein
MDALGGPHDTVIRPILAEFGQYALHALVEVVLRGPENRVGPAADAIAALREQGSSVGRGELTEMRRFIYRNQVAGGPRLDAVRTALGPLSKEGHAQARSTKHKAPRTRARHPPAAVHTFDSGEELYAAAHEAGLVAARRYLPEQPSDSCGYAWVLIPSRRRADDAATELDERIDQFIARHRPDSSPPLPFKPHDIVRELEEYLREHGLVRREPEDGKMRMGINDFGQSYYAKSAYAEAFAAVLVGAGVRAEWHDLVD